MKLLSSALARSIQRSWTNVASRHNFKTCSRLACAQDDKKEDVIAVHYVVKDGHRLTRYGKEGENVMQLAQRNDIDIEGACEASLACCTCHVYVRQEDAHKLSPPSEEEEDLLDMAPFLKSNSRLSCQIILSKELEGIEVTLPPVTRNFYVDGKKPSHH